MLTLVIGGSGSGKSAFAEALAARLDGHGIYLATMMTYDDEESRKRIRRHRRQRAGLGFETLERATDLAGAEVPSDANILLEDLSNLLANEMFSPPKRESPLNGSQNEQKEELESDGDLGEGAETGSGSRRALDNVRRGLKKLESSCANLTVVTNEVFSGGGQYEGETLQFMKNLACLNREIASRAQLVVEVVCGIPNVLKGELP